MPIIGSLAGASAKGWGGLLNFNMTSSYESIQTVTVGAGGQGTIVFNSIPSGYTHLQVRAFNVSAATYADVRFNGDTGSNYVFHQIESSGSISTSGGNGQTSIYTNQLGGNATYPTIGIIDIYDYANTSKNKTVRLLSGVTSTSGGQIYFRSGVWLSNNAITSMTFRAVAGGSTFNEHTKYALYGMKGV